MKTIIIAVLLLVMLSACEKQHKMRCIQCEKIKYDGIIYNGSYVPGYCGTDEMAQDYLNNMAAQKWSYDKPMYRCWEVEP